MKGFAKVRNQFFWAPWVSKAFLVGCYLWVLGCGAEVGQEPLEEPATGFTLGVLFDYSGALGESGPEAENGVRLAVDHINAGGGVLGQPVGVVVADGATQADVAVAGARKLIAEDGVHALVGPFGSAAALAVAEQVSRQEGIPTISPSATSPLLTQIEDAGFFFRTTLSDAAQGPILARLAQDEGFERVAVFYRDDVYGRGLQAAFAQSFAGEITASVAIVPEQETYLEALQQAVIGEPQALVAITFPYEAAIFVKEAVERKLFDRFLLGDALAAQDFISEVGAEALEGSKGTGAASPGADNVGTQAVLKSYTEAYGRPPLRGPVLQAYDAAVCLCLAAEYAGSFDGPAIRDALPKVCGGDGEAFTAGAESISEALASLRTSQKVNYQGAATPTDFNAAGDVRVGHVAVWQIQGGAVKPIERIPVRFDG